MRPSAKEHGTLKVEHMNMVYGVDINLKFAIKQGRYGGFFN
jgi:hypothetical protein